MGRTRKVCSIPARHRRPRHTSSKRTHITVTNPTSPNLLPLRVHLKDINTTLPILATTRTDNLRINIGRQTKDNSTTRLNNTITTPVPRIRSPPPRHRRCRSTRFPCPTTRIRLCNHAIGTTFVEPIRIPCHVPTHWDNIRSTITRTTLIPERTKSSLRNLFNNSTSRRRGSRLACTLARRGPPIDAYEALCTVSRTSILCFTVAYVHFVVSFFCIPSAFS